MTGFPFKPAKAVSHLKAADPALAAIIDAVGPFRMELKVSRSLFGALAEAIVYQQLSNKAAATIYGRVEALFPRATDGFTPRHILKTPDESLRGCGLSRAKVLAVKDLAQRVAGGELPTLEQAHDLADAELIERLIKVRKAYAKAFRKRALPSPQALEKAGEKWRPYRTVASWYLWRALELP
jgi:3-methyladenine DNA glycosylase/8-oxoguanine DNA glycosylase